MPQQLRHPCGCIETIHKPFDPAFAYIELCPQHLAIMNSQGPKPPIDRILPPSQTSTTTQGIPSFVFPQFQRGAGFHPSQMPQQGVYTGNPTSGTGR
jgi:hypothetical protein